MLWYKKFIINHLEPNMERDDGGRFILFIQRYFISLLSSRVSRVWLQWSRLASFFPTTIADVVKFAAADYFAYSAWRNSDEMVTSIILPWGRRVSGLRIFEAADAISGSEWDDEENFGEILLIMNWNCRSTSFRSQRISHGTCKTM